MSLVKHAAQQPIRGILDAPSNAPPVRNDATRKRLEFIARNLADLGENATNLGDEPLAMLVHRAWQRAASLLLKLPPSDSPGDLTRRS